MTRAAVASRRGIPRTWLLPLLALAGILGAAAAGWLSQAVLIDLAAWWPLWILIAVLALLARGRRWGKVRMSGVVPLAAVAGLGVFVWGYLAGWEAMPSASLRLVGPEVGQVTDAALSVRVDGDVVLSGADSRFLYQVEPSRQGGELGPPSAVERSQESIIGIELSPVEDPGLYQFSGWEIAVSSRAAWSLGLEGGVDADLTGIELTGLQLAGQGVTRLGSVAGEVPVSISGEFSLLVPAGTPVHVVGGASVPASWQSTDDGFRSPAEGSGWVVSVADGSSLSVQESR